MLYYGVSLTIIGGLTSTPLQSMLSKCVKRDEYGKIFTLSSVASAIASVFAQTMVQKLYKHTVESFPGAMYVFLGCGELLTVFMMSILFIYVIRIEKTHGPIGAEQSDSRND